MDAMLLSQILLGVALLRLAHAFQPPNVLLMLADDLGWNDVGHHGGEIPTPNIDALGYHGVIFGRHYSQPACTPSRAALLTGRYPIRMGMQGVPIAAGFPEGIPLKEKLLPQYLSELGYESHIVGKWHLGSQTKDYLPTSRGFKSHFGYWHGYIGHYDGIHAPIGTDRKGMDMHRGVEDAWEESYSKHITHLLTEEAVKVIRGHGRKGGLLLEVAHAAPHTGNPGTLLLSPPDQLDHRRRNNITDHKRRIYADMVKALDESVGKIVLTLAEEGMLHNSIIIFLSDNGAPSHDELWHFDNGGSNWPFRGEKCSIHEGGIRTAAVMWSALLENPGRIYNNLFHISDWLPTLYSAAGGETIIKGIDGVDHWKRLMTGKGHGPRKLMLADLEDDGAEALISGKWKLIRNNVPSHPMAYSDKYYGESGRDMDYDVNEVAESMVGKLIKGKSKRDYMELREATKVDSNCLRRMANPVPIPCYKHHCLYDMTLDPCESLDLSQQYPHVVAEMKAVLARYRAVMVPKPNVTFDPKSHPRNWGHKWVTWMDTPSSSPHLIPLSMLIGIVTGLSLMKTFCV